MRKLLDWWIRVMRARQARAEAEMLKRLDAHTRRDIGLEAWHSELSHRIEVQRERTLLRLATLRFGSY